MCTYFPGLPDLEGGCFCCFPTRPGNKKGRLLTGLGHTHKTFPPSFLRYGLGNPFITLFPLWKAPHNPSQNPRVEAVFLQPLLQDLAGFLLGEGEKMTFRIKQINISINHPARQASASPAGRGVFMLPGWEEGEGTGRKQALEWAGGFLKRGVFIKGGALPATRPLRRPPGRATGCPRLLRGLVHRL